MATRTLTDRFVKTARPIIGPREEFFDHLQPGFALRVSASGAKSWVVFYRHAGRLRRHTLGSYPALPLADARQKARDAIKAAQGGADPAAEKRAAREAETFAELAPRYLTLHAQRKKKSWTEDRRIITNELLPAWRHAALRDLTRADVRALIEAKAATAPVMANRLLALISRMFNFALERDWMPFNPAARMSKPGQEHSRERVLTDAEIRTLWTALEADGETPLLTRRIADVFKLRLITAQRGSEVIRMRWQDLSLEDKAGWWTIPATDTKNKQTHRVFLTGRAVAILKTCKAEAQAEAVYVFPTLNGHGPAIDLHRRSGRLFPQLAGGDVHPHDLRRTAATKMAEAGVSRVDIARVLNHVDRGPRATSVYDRYSYDKEKRAALKTWGRVLTKILEAKPGGVR